MGKYGEPWKMTKCYANPQIEKNRGGLVVADGMMLEPKEIQRAVACVNACEGIEHPERIKHVLAAMYHAMPNDDQYTPLFREVEAWLRTSNHQRGE